MGQTGSKGCLVGWKTERKSPRKFHFRSSCSLVGTAHTYTSVSAPCQPPPKYQQRSIHMRWTGELAMLRLAGSAPGLFIGAGFDMESSERGSLRERTAMAVEDTQLCCLTRESFLHLKEAFPTTLKRVEKAAT